MAWLEKLIDSNVLTQDNIDFGALQKLSLSAATPASIQNIPADGSGFTTLATAVELATIAGYLDTEIAAIPEDIVTAILFIAENRYYHGDREEALDRAIDSLLFTHRLWKF